MTNYPALHMIIDGEAVTGGDRRTQTIVNPATGETLGELPLATTADLDRALETAQRGFNRWRNSTAQERAAVLSGAARLLMERQETLARIATMEQGKTLPESRIEVMMVAGLFNFYAGEVSRLYGRALVRPAGMRSTVTYEPVGPVAAFSPWNFPLGNPGRKLGAPIAAGCSVIMKSAEETPASALGVLQCLLDAGLPKDVAQAVFGVPDEVSRHLLASPIIRKLSFTGSTVIGKHLAKLAAEDLKRTTMELGGHGPVLVFDDVDVDRVLDVMVGHKYRNAGQVCVSPTRFIVQENVYERFRDGFASRAKALKVGNGLEDGIQMGPMANERRPDAMERLIGGAVSSGAKLNAGGERIGNQGFFYAPSVLSEIPLDAEIMNEEPFGPVALINPFGKVDDMIAEANRLPYGLAAYSWTDDVKLQRRVAREVETGMLGVNSVAIGGADSPFGGVKWSGHGHEDGPEGLHACLVTKVVHEG
ncbi:MULTISPECIES: NAD-dependent succinate-semialdehyde dehydrogenase [Sphingobium]|uniref:NAD-dependent succinate-semialdehyde dehydrogenase n=1 Tax=Sphingobium TaxID=165695 RepID=UPI0015EBFBBA|nr:MULTISPECIES: NAD-dependent succinate-semialdehyde dehydrogenase [Sphingobium]MCW2361523.1 succinate-semialdehyde dehydrogenase/glutarate-semialdehyde dehydrogenase [Sphingobium sp. B10D3B]MCW2366679.1 succinate-semialdehyde dehydrogenase/glutarate-semialdehyde dehydrogenase [Sphingobium sp. B7D2B]MCW2382031.1 succinate-semialdehyde dehydrogenase/glutarate-semialdehyde dehydrogenase [Sphingobium sp. B2D3B]MCW2394306.1 succinate-semialdehyde dehydrogenase/glutarate-semialdehyde dehydrogenase 